MTKEHLLQRRNRKIDRPALPGAVHLALAASPSAAILVLSTSFGEPFRDVMLLAAPAQAHMDERLLLAMPAPRDSLAMVLYPDSAQRPRVALIPPEGLELTWVVLLIKLLFYFFIWTHVRCMAVILSGGGCENLARGLVRGNVPSRRGLCILG